MKFKEIKPGMVIHCPKEEDARALLRHLKEIGYTWAGGFAMPTGNEVKPYFFDEEDAETAYRMYQGETGLCTAFDTVDAYTSKGYEITEFSDLIEPEDSTQNSTEKSAKYIIWWLMIQPNEILADVLGYESLDEIFQNNSVESIIDKITAYEAEKKKPAEVEWINVCEIYGAYGNGARTWIDEVILPGGAKKELAEEILRKYMAEHEGDYYAVVERRCRVKEDK